MARQHPTWVARKSSEAHAASHVYPVDTLVTVLGLDPGDRQLTATLARRLGMDRSWVRRCRREGLTSAGAEHWATRLGLHPARVWRAWSDDVGEEIPGECSCGPERRPLDVICDRCGRDLPGATFEEASAA